MRTATARRHITLGAAVLLAAFTALKPQAAEDPMDQWEVVPEAPALGRPVFGNDRFVAWDSTGARESYVSSDGSGWSQVPHSLSTGDGLAFGSGLFLHYNQLMSSPVSVETSSDGFEWTTVNDSEVIISVWPWRDQFWALQPVWGPHPEQPDLLVIIGSEVFASPDGHNWTTNSAFLPFDGEYDDPFVGGGGRVLGTAFLPREGPHDAFVLSEDGREWTVLTNVAGVRLQSRRGLAYGNSTYVWLAKPEEPESSQQVVFTSTNGMNWSPQTTTTTNELSAIAYGNKAFVVGGSNGTLLSSPDGTNWTARPSGTAADLSHAVFGGGRFVLTGEAVVRSAVQPQAVGEIRFMPRLCRRLSDGTMLLTVEGPYGQPVYVEASTNLVDWEVIAADACDRGEFEVYDEAAADLPHRFYRATQGEPPPPPLPDDPLMNWSVADTVLEEGQFLSWKLAHGNGAFVAAGKKSDNASGSAWYSEGGLTWQPSNSTAPHENLAFGAGRFASWAGELPMSTVNGQDWTERDPVGGIAVWGQMVFGRGQFSGTEPLPRDDDQNRGTWFVSSTDGMHWTTNMIPPLPLVMENQGVYGMSVAYAKGRMVFLDSLKIVSSTEGEHWDVGPHCLPQPPWPFTCLDAVFYGRGRFIARGNQQLRTSEDGVTWVYEQYRSPQPELAAYANGTFLGESRDSSRHVSRMYGSADGLTWTNLVEIQTSAAPSDLLFAEGRFHFVTRGGEVWRSEVMPPHVDEPRVIPGLTYRLPDGAMLVTVEAPYGHEVVVEGSEDLESWQEIGRDPCDRGEFEIYHETAPPGTDWFYRARQVEP